MLLVKFFGMIFNVIGFLITLVISLIEPAIVIFAIVSLIAGITNIIFGKDIKDRATGVFVLIFGIISSLIIFN